MEAINGMKVFAMNDSDWYVAEDAHHALRAMMDALGYESEEEMRADGVMPTGYPAELTDQFLDTLHIRVDLDGEGEHFVRRSFREHLLAEPPTQAEMFCTTDY